MPQKFSEPGRILNSSTSERLPNNISFSPPSLSLLTHSLKTPGLEISSLSLLVSFSTTYALGLFSLRVDTVNIPNSLLLLSVTLCAPWPSISLRLPKLYAPAELKVLEVPWMCPAVMGFCSFTCATLYLKYLSYKDTFNFKVFLGKISTKTFMITRLG